MHATQDMTVFRRGSEEGCLQPKPQRIECVQSESGARQMNREGLKSPDACSSSWGFLSAPTYQPNRLDSEDWAGNRAPT